MHNNRPGTSLLHQPLCSLVAMVFAVASPLAAQTFDFETYAGAATDPVAFDVVLSGRITTPPPSQGSVDGIRTAARFSQPMGVAFDANGNLFIADLGNHTIRKIDPAGVVTTLAGLAGSSGHVDAIGAVARFNAPYDLAVDASGTVYVSDSGNHVIRAITPAGEVTTFAGSPALAGDAAGLGAASRFDTPRRIALDSTGNLFVADSGNGLIRKVTPAGEVSTYATIVARNQDGTLQGPTFSSIAIDASDSVFVGHDGAVKRVAGDGQAQIVADGNPDSINDIAFDSQGELIASAGNFLLTVTSEQTFRRIAGMRFATSHASIVNQYADDTGRYAWFRIASGLAFDGDGNLFVADSSPDSNTIRRGIPVAAISRSRLTNLSVRSFVQDGDETTIIGFVAQGTGIKHLLLRGIGPGLEDFGVSTTLRRPHLHLHNSAGSRLASAVNWQSGAPGLGVAETVTSMVGAFDITSGPPDIVGSGPTDIDSVFGLQPGAYTVVVDEQIAATDGTKSGNALVEVYDGDVSWDTSRFLNLSARTFVGTGDQITIAGFVVSGPTSLRLLIRGIGPTLAQHGVSGFLADPLLRLYRESEFVEENDDWNGDPGWVTILEVVGAFIPEFDSKDSGLLVTLEPGAYSAHVLGVGGTTGVALVEIYEVPE